MLTLCSDEKRGADDTLDSSALREVPRRKKDFGCGILFVVTFSLIAKLTYDCFL